MSMMGKSLAHYEITAELGKGGMGEVYQAKDHKLGRDVAIKVLPQEFARDAERVARFQREAKLLASLNHNNIAGIYGLEESGGTHFLVLELIEGQTLRERIKSGPIPVEESLKLSLQIAEALEAAHEKGVIHRDLKPANIKVTPDGKVKVLDFGLAKAYAGGPEDINLSNSPTLSDAATQQGVILGTAAYMSPEQAKGKTVDKRADIWAFGVVLFEMLTGRQVFTGETVSDTLASVLAREPQWQSLPPNLHPRIRFLLERCLKKEPKNRYHDIADARVDIQEVLADPGGVFAPSAVTEAGEKSQKKLLWLSATVILIIIAGIVVWKMKPGPEPKQPIYFSYDLPANLTGPGATAISPDGNTFAYSTTDGLYLQSVNRPGTRLIFKTDEKPEGLFFSPNGQWVGYFSQSEHKLKKIALSGGAPVTLCDIKQLFLGATWNTDNTIFFSQVPDGIMRIPAEGGTPKTVIKADESKISEVGFPTMPRMLPDGKSLLYTSIFNMNPLQTKIMALSLESGDRKELLEGANARYLPTGHLVYLLGEIGNMDLMAAPFDPDKFEVTGGSVPLLEGITGGTVSKSGTLAYISQPGIKVEYGRTLVWVDHEGVEESIPAPPSMYHTPKISPDGKEIAVAVSENDNNEYIYIWEPSGENLRRLTFDKGVDSVPLWTPDGKRIVFISNRDGKFDIYWKAADGTGKEESLCSVPDKHLFPWSWADHGKTLVMHESALDYSHAQIGTLAMDGKGTYKTLTEEKNWAAHPRVSPNGRFMAYITTEDDPSEDQQYEIFVCPFPEVTGGRWQISTGGGQSPLWSPDGRELFYISPDGIMAAQVNTETTFSNSKPEKLFQGDYVTGYSENPEWDISPDGKRFLMMKPPGVITRSSASTETLKLNIVMNWFEKLKEKVPVD